MLPLGMAKINEEDVILQCMSKAKLALHYGVSTPTVLKWCRILGIDDAKGELLSPKEICIIYLEKGLPSSIKKNLAFTKDQVVVWGSAVLGSGIATQSDGE